MSKTSNAPFAKRPTCGKVTSGVAAALAVALMSGGAAQAGGTTTVVTPANFATTGWYTDTSANGTAIISGDQPRSGNGSLELSVPSYGDHATAVHYGGDGLTFSSLVNDSANQLGFDYYRDSSSTVSSNAAPAYHLYIGQYSNQLVWEAAYNGANTTTNPIPTDSWQTVNIKDGLFWERTGGTNYDAANEVHPLSYWLTDPTFAGKSIVDYSVGLGSGLTGAYKGSVDNVTFGTNTTNFELPTATPEPSSFALFGLVGLGLTGLIVRARRRVQSS